MNVYIGQNTKNVEEFIEYVRQKIIAAASNWREIAAAFAEAKEMYGFDSDAFKRLCKATKFSSSKASKLATIAASERLKKYEKELEAVQSWTVLYDITRLDDEQFERLLKDRDASVVDNGKSVIISSAMVNKARQVARERSSMRVYAQVSVDIEAVRAQMMDGDSIAALEAALRDIQIKIPYVKVEKWDVFEKEDREYMDALHRAFIIERRAAFIEEIDKMFKRRAKAKHETKEQYEKRVLGQSRASVMADFAADAMEAFKYLTGDYDEGELYNRGQSRVSKNLEKIVKKVKGKKPASK